MPKAFIEPEQMSALTEVFHEAKRLLEHQGITGNVELEGVARRIIDLARQGTPAWTILSEILPPLAQETGAVPEAPDDQAISPCTSTQASPI